MPSTLSGGEIKTAFSCSETAYAHWETGFLFVMPVLYRSVGSPCMGFSGRTQLAGDLLHFSLTSGSIRTEFDARSRLSPCGKAVSGSTNTRAPMDAL